MRFRALPVCAFAFAMALAAPGRAETLAQKVDPWVLEKASAGETDFLVMLRDQADLRGARSLAVKTEKGAFIADTLRAHAGATQAPLLRLLKERGVAHRAFWVANMVLVRGDHALVEEIAAREDVFHVYANPSVRFDGPVAQRAAADVPEAPDAIEWNVARIHAPEVWALGDTGQGVVVGGQDTGYQWNHAALKSKYRGWSGLIANHNYNWHDAIHSGGGSCGADAPAPCDDTSHGTHTMGTMVGDDGGSNQIGVAPGARWIGCRNMDQGAGTPATYSECFEWFIAPTNLQNLNPDPAKAPDVINNSWGCPPSEGCTDPTVLQTVVENTRAAGIEVVVSAGNSGNACSTVSDPPAIYDASFSVGATNSSDQIAGFSSRGPVTVDGSNRLKPDVSAPGVGVRSSVPGGYAVFDGTSMAGPHIVGLVALLLSASPDLAGDPDAIESVITSTAVPRTSSQSCGDVPGSDVPNNTYGWGRADALAAVDATSADLALSQTDTPDPTLAGVPVTYAFTIQNLGPGSAAGVSLADTLSLAAAIDSATPSQGSCTLLAHAVTCDLGALESGASATVDVTITPTSNGVITSAATVSGTRRDPSPGNDAATETTAVTECPFLAPVITAPVSVPPATGGLAASSDSGAGHTATWTLTGGAITGGQGTSAVTLESGDPGTTMLLELTDSLGACEVAAAAAAISVDFTDVPPSNIFHDAVNTAARNGISNGCGGGNYCPASPVTRGQMAVFLLRSKYGAGHEPPAATGTVFVDVDGSRPFDPWIEELGSLGITGGCGGGAYCPDAPVTRAQMAVFLLKTRLGSDYEPPAPDGIFADVPIGSFADAWIEELHGRSITTGCSTSPLQFCPDNANTLGQMAVFLVKTFELE